MNRLKHLFTGRHYHRLRVPVQISAPCEGISASRGDPSLRHRLPLLPPPISASLRVKEYNAWCKTTHQRKTLPPELSRDVVTLTCKSSANGGVCDVYVVTKSCRDVQAVIDLVKPQVVFVELCSNRGHVIIEDFDKDELESEFAVAYGEAKKYGAKIIRRSLWSMKPLWEMHHSVKDGLLRLPKPLAKQVKEWDDCDVSANSHEVEKYMSASLLEVARKHNSVVAVMQKNWKQPFDITQWRLSAKMPLWHMIRWLLWEMYHSVKDGLLRLLKPLAKQVKEWDDFDVSANSHKLEKLCKILVILLAIIIIRMKILLQRVTRDDDNGVED